MAELRVSKKVHVKDLVTEEEIGEWLDHWDEHDNSELDSANLMERSKEDILVYLTEKLQFATIDDLLLDWFDIKKDLEVNLHAN